jgi:hypothetical protein
MPSRPQNHSAADFATSINSRVTSRHFVPRPAGWMS